MPQVTMQQLETQTTEIIRAVREERIAYEIVEDGERVAVLSPAPAESPVQAAMPDSDAIALVETWLDEADDESGGSLDEFLAFIEESRLDLSTES